LLDFAANSAMMTRCRFPGVSHAQLGGDVLGAPWDTPFVSAVCHECMMHVSALSGAGPQQPPTAQPGQARPPRSPRPRQLVSTPGEPRVDWRARRATLRQLLSHGPADSGASARAQEDGSLDTLVHFLTDLRAAVGDSPAADAPTCRLPDSVLLRPRERLFMEAVEGALADAVTAESLVRGSSFAGLLERALVVLDVLKRHGPPPNVSIYKLLIVAAGRSGRTLLALSLLDELSGLGLRPDLRCVHALVDNLTSEHVIVAAELLTKLRAPLDVKAINALLWLCADPRAGPIDARAVLVHQLLSALPEHGLKPDETTLAASVSALGRANRLDDALVVWTHLKAAGVSPGQRSWASLLAACRHAEQHEMCWSLFCTLRDEQEVSITLVHFNIVIDSAVRAQQHTRAFALAKAITAAGLSQDLVTRNCLLPAVAAVEGLHAALEQASAPGYGADVVTWTRIMELAAQEGQPAVASAALDAMQRSGIEPDVVAWTTLIRAHGPDAREALLTWKRMRENGVNPDAHTFLALLRCSMRANDTALATKVYAAMRRAGMTPNDTLFKQLLANSADAALNSRASRSQVLDKEAAEEPPHSDAAAQHWLPASLDLHGLSAAEARATVLCALRDFRDSGEKPPPDGLVIITGRGSNNPKGVAVLRDEVVRLLGELRLRCSVDERNPGRVRVPMHTLRTFLQRTSSTSLPQS